MSFLPSQKFIIIVLIMILMGSLAYAYILYKNQIAETETNTIFNEAKGTISVAFNTENIMSQDSDKDGITDIDENILGLDPNADSTEAKKIIDEQVKEKEDKYGDILAILNSNTDTETEKFAKSLYNATGQNSDPKEVAKIAKENLQKLISRGTYSDASFKTNGDTSKADLTYYLKRYFKTLIINNNDLARIREAVGTSENVNKLELIKVINKIDNAEQFLLTLSYPADSVPYFKDLANSHVYLKNVLTQLLKANNDPIISLTALSLLDDAFKDISTQYEKIFN